MVKQYKYALHRSIKMARHKYRDGAIVKEQFGGSDTMCMWQGLLTSQITKKKASHVGDTNTALPDELNTFFSHSKHNDSELPSSAREDNEGYVITASTEDVCGSFKCVNSCMAAS